MPHFTNLDHAYKSREWVVCAERVHLSIQHCNTLFTWLRTRPQAQLAASHPHYYDAHAARTDGAHAGVVLITKPASWEQASELPTLDILDVCMAEEARLHQLAGRLSGAQHNPDASLRAIVELHDLEIRLASAKAAIQAWLQAEQQPAPGTPLPMCTYDLSKTPGALCLYEDLLVKEMGWGSFSVIPTSAEALQVAQACLADLTVPACLKLCARSRAAQQQQGSLTACWRFSGQLVSLQICIMGGCMSQFVWSSCSAASEQAGSPAAGLGHLVRPCDCFDTVRSYRL